MNHRDLFSLLGWGSVVERERHRRIKLSIWAYAYEIENKPLVDDLTFDTECLKSDPAVQTGRLDDWWQNNFNPSTGMWIHNHPELGGIERLYERWNT